MKIAVNGWMVCGFEGEFKLQSVVKQIKEMDWDGIELCYGAGELSPTITEREIQNIKTMLDAEGLEVPSLATGFYWGCSLGSPDEGERTKAIEFTKKYIETACQLGAGAVLVLPGTVDVCFDPNRPVVSAKEVWKWAQDSINRIIPTAEQYKVVIALENVWSKFLTGPFEFAQFIDLFHSPWVKAYFDAGNCIINGYPEHWVEILVQRISRVHVKNFKRVNGGGTLDNFTTSLLEGDMNWEKLFQSLKSVGYDYYLTAEVIVGEQGMPNIEQTKRVAQELKMLLSK